MRSAPAALGSHSHGVSDAPDEERSMEIASLGDRLSALRLCDAAALRAVEHSLDRHGQLSPIGVFVDGQERLEVLDGFKRVRAARALGWPHVRGRILAGASAVDAKLLLAVLHEHRGLTEIEEAWLVRSLYRDDKLSQPEIARLLSRHKSWVCRRLALVESLDSEVSAEVRLGLLAPRAAVAVAALPRGNQRAASAVVIRHGMTVRQTEHFVRELADRPDNAARAARIAECLEAGPRKSAGETPVVHKTHAERITQDIETLRTAAARLQTRLLATALDTLGAPAAELVRASLARLLPVLGALGVTAAQAVGEDRAA
jgi:ParB-like chromosome segregation protein Spo0J